MFDLAIVTLASLFAGCVDAIVGGGGLILVPALFGVFPNAAPATLLGTNKATGIWGTGWAAVQFSRRVKLPMRALLPAAIVALLGSFAGAWTLTLVSADGLRKALPIILVAVLFYTVLRKDMGLTHAPSRSRRMQALIACAIGLVIGFYDGFFGPGTGSFLIFVFVGLFGFSFLAASASAKAVNSITNFAALCYFIASGNILFEIAIPMAVFNVAGSLAGARLALARGSGFVRKLFIVIVGVLIARFGYDIIK